MHGASDGTGNQDFSQARQKRMERIVKSRVDWELSVDVDSENAIGFSYKGMKREQALSNSFCGGSDSQREEKNPCSILPHQQH